MSNPDSNTSLLNFDPLHFTSLRNVLTLFYVLLLSDSNKGWFLVRSSTCLFFFFFSSSSPWLFRRTRPSGSASAWPFHGDPSPYVTLSTLNSLFFMQIHLGIRCSLSNYTIFRSQYCVLICSNYSSFTCEENIFIQMA